MLFACAKFAFGQWTRGPDASAVVLLLRLQMALLQPTPIRILPRWAQDGWP